MVEITKDVFVGSANDYESIIKKETGWFVIQACKEPYHRDAIGYIGRSLDKEHPEYLMAYRPNRLILNLVDAQRPEFFSPKIIDTTLKTINIKLKAKYKILIHCNLGYSRGPSIGFLYLVSIGIFKNKSLQEALNKYKEIYPNYSPGIGIKEYINQNYKKYSN